MGISIASALAVALTVHSVSSFSLLSPRALTAPPSLRRAAGGVCTQKDGWAMQERKTPSKMRQGEGESGWMERLGKGGGVKGAGLAAAAVCASALLCLSPMEISAGPTPLILDDARSFSTVAREKLDSNLQDFETETGYKVRVITRDGRRQDKAEAMGARNIKALWGLPDPKAVVVIVQAGNGNVLGFNSGDEVNKLLPSRFFEELKGRLGNVYTVAEDGEAGVVQEAVSAIEVCLRKGGCQVVPGVGKDQYYATLTCSSFAGVIFGTTFLFTTPPPKAKGKSGNVWKFYPLLTMPLWGTFLLLGVNPLFQRAADPTLIAQNFGAFFAIAVVVKLVGPLVRYPNLDREE